MTSLQLSNRKTIEYSYFTQRLFMARGCVIVFNQGCFGKFNVTFRNCKKILKE